MTTSARGAYTDAGVDVEAGDRAVLLLRSRIGATDDLLAGSDAFAAATVLPGGLREPVIVTSTDGVGTKTEIARAMGRLDTIGWDLVAMCADDVVCHGGRPWLFLDYLAVGRVDPDAVAAIVGGVAAACASIGCALVGGETAEHPGTMAPDAFDLAGFCVGVVERGLLLDGSTARAGDVLLGMASSGMHANGFSLVRAMLAREGLDLGTPLGELEALGGDEALDSEETLGEALLRPTRLYARDVLALIDALGRGGQRLSGLAHVTGGGLPGNLPRAVPSAMGVLVDPSAWPVPPVMTLIARLAGLDGIELRATFNGGIGMVAVLEPRAVSMAQAVLGDRGLENWVIGEVVPITSSGERYTEAS